MKYVEVIDKQAVLNLISQTIESMRKNYIPVNSVLPELYYDISRLPTSGHFEMEDTDNQDYDPFYQTPKAPEYNICPLKDTIPC